MTNAMECLKLKMVTRVKELFEILNGHGIATVAHDHIADNCVQSQESSAGMIIKFGEIMERFQLEDTANSSGFSASFLVLCCMLGVILGAVFATINQAAKTRAQSQQTAQSQPPPYEDA